MFYFCKQGASSKVFRFSFKVVTVLKFIDATIKDITRTNENKHTWKFTLKTKALNLPWEAGPLSTEAELKRHA